MTKAASGRRRPFALGPCRAISIILRAGASPDAIRSDNGSSLRDKKREKLREDRHSECTARDKLRQPERRYKRTCAYRKPALRKNKIRPRQALAKSLPNPSATPPPKESCSVHETTSERFPNSSLAPPIAPRWVPPLPKCLGLRHSDQSFGDIVDSYPMSGEEGPAPKAWEVRGLAKQGQHHPVSPPRVRPKRVPAPHPSKKACLSRRTPVSSASK